MVKKSWPLKTVVLVGCGVGVAYFVLSTLTGADQFVSNHNFIGGMIGSAVGGMFWALVVNFIRNKWMK